jgi:hypothetical protein
MMRPNTIKNTEGMTHADLVFKQHEGNFVHLQAIVTLDNGYRASIIYGAYTYPTFSQHKNYFEVAVIYGGKVSEPTTVSPNDVEGFLKRPAAIEAGSLEKLSTYDAAQLLGDEEAE